MRLIGLDPGLRLTGWGVIDVDGNRLRYVAHGVIKVASTRPLPNVSTTCSTVSPPFSGITSRSKPPSKRPS